MTFDGRLELLTLDHGPALERFELANRAFFAARVGDRGDSYFERFADLLAALVGENQEGTALLFVLVEPDGEVLGRVNITDVDQPELTELGYRVAERAQGQGVATFGVRAALAHAAARGVRSVRARVAVTNLASVRVLEKCGFVLTGPTPEPDATFGPLLGYRIPLEAASE